MSDMSDTRIKVCSSFLQAESAEGKMFVVNLNNVAGFASAPDGNGYMSFRRPIAGVGGVELAVTLEEFMDALNEQGFWEFEGDAAKD